MVLEPLEVDNEFVLLLPFVVEVVEVVKRRNGMGMCERCMCEHIHAPTHMPPMHICPTRMYHVHMYLDDALVMHLMEVSLLAKAVPRRLGFVGHLKQESMKNEGECGVSHRCVRLTGEGLGVDGER